MDKRTIGLVAGSLVFGALALAAIIFFSPGQSGGGAGRTGAGAPGASQSPGTGSGAATAEELEQVRDLVRRTPTASRGAETAGTLDLRRGPGGVPAGMRVPMVEVQRMNEQGRIGQWYRAADPEPLEGGWVRLQEPSAWIYLSESRMLVVDAMRAHVFWPNEGRPERGRLDQGVRVRIFETDPARGGDIYAVDPTVEEAVFDVVTDSLEFETSPYQVRSADRVEVFTPQLDLAGRGMTLYFNEADERVEYLHFDEREYIRLRPSGERGESDLAAAPDASRREAGSAERAPSSRSSTRTPGGKVPPGAAAAAGAADAPADPVAEAPEWYRLVLDGGVEIVRGFGPDEVRIVGQALEAEFALGEEGLEGGLSTGSAADSRAPLASGREPAPAVTPAASQGRPLPLLQRVAMLPFAATSQPAMSGPASGPAKSSGPLVPQSVDEVLIFGSGPLTLQPQAGTPVGLRHPADRRVLVQGEPVNVEGEFFRAVCVRAEYVERSVARSSVDGSPPVVQEVNLRLEPSPRQHVELEWIGAGIARSRHPVVFNDPGDVGPFGDIDPGLRADERPGAAPSAADPAAHTQGPEASGRPRVVFEGPGAAATTVEVLPDAYAPAAHRTMPSNLPRQHAIAAAVFAGLRQDSESSGDRSPVVASSERSPSPPAGEPDGSAQGANLPGVPAGFLITWDRRLEIEFSRDERRGGRAADRNEPRAPDSDASSGSIGRIESAEFFGNVKVDDPRGLALNAERLRAEFASLSDILIRQRQESAGYPMSNRSEGDPLVDGGGAPRANEPDTFADDSPQLAWIEAEGEVEATSADGGTARANRLEVRFGVDRATERSAPEAIMLLGSVYAMLNGDAIRHADYMQVDLEPAADGNDGAQESRNDDAMTESPIVDAGPENTTSDAAAADPIPGIAGDDLRVREVLARGNIHIALADGLHAYGETLLADPAAEYATLSGSPVVVRQGPLVFMSDQLAIDQANQTMTADSPGRMVNLEAPSQASIEEVEQVGRLGVDVLLGEARRRLGEPIEAASVLPPRFARGEVPELAREADAPEELPADGQGNDVDSAGAAAAVAQATRAGPDLSTWSLTRIGWSEGVFFSDADGLIEIAGDARVESLPNASEFNAVDAERIRVRLSKRLSDLGIAPAPQPRTSRGRAAPPGASAPPVQEVAFGDREVLEIEALGREAEPARVNAVRYAQPGVRDQVASRFALASPVIHYYRIPQRVDCLGSGSLLIVDSGAPETDAGPEAADPTLGVGRPQAPSTAGTEGEEPVQLSGRGETLITWTGSLVFDGDDLTAAFRDDVYLLHRPPDDEVINLQAAELDVDFQPSAPAARPTEFDLLSASGSGGQFRLESFEAREDVLVVTDERRIEAAGMSYVEELAIAVLEGDRVRNEPVIIAPNLQRLYPGGGADETAEQRARRLAEAARLRPLRAMKATWDLLSDTVRIEEAMPVRGARP